LEENYFEKCKQELVLQNGKYKLGTNIDLKSFNNSEQFTKDSLKNWKIKN
jgi:hypothetical protein